MPLDQIANFVRGEADTAIDNTQTTISVVDATVFPDPSNGEYNLVLWDSANHPRPDQDADVEVVRVTARDTGTDELTVTRGQESTSGVSHPSGSALQLAPTAGVFDDIAPNDQNVEDFQTASTTADEVPTAQGDGSLAMEPKGGDTVADNQEDTRIWSGDYSPGAGGWANEAIHQRVALDGSDGTILDQTVPAGECWFVNRIYVTTDGSGDDSSVFVNFGIAESTIFNNTDPDTVQRGGQLGGFDTTVNSGTEVAIGSYAGAGETIRAEEVGDGGTAGGYYVTFEIHKATFDESSVNRISIDGATGSVETISIPSGEIWYLDSAIADTDGTGDESNAIIEFGVADTTTLDNVGDGNYDSTARGLQIAAIDTTGAGNGATTSVDAYAYGGEEIRVHEENDGGSTGGYNFALLARRVV